MKNYMSVSKSDILNDPRFKKVDIVADVQALRSHIARDLADKIKENNRRGKGTTAILPVSPLDYTMLADILNREAISLEDFCIINMDDLLGSDGKRIPRTKRSALRIIWNAIFIRVSILSWV